MIDGVRARVMRLTTYVLFLSVCATGLLAKKAHANAAAGALAIGERLLDVPTDREGRDLLINGQPFHVTATQSAEPLAAVLEKLEHACEAHADDMLANLKELGKPGTGFPGIGVLKDRRGDRGVVACFAIGRESDPFELARRLDRFSRSKDLADLGALRFVAARSLENGATQLVATSTDGSVRLDAMFPESGEAAGDDPTFAPRPAGTRVLSAHDRAAPYGVFVYRTRAPEAYDKQLVARGFTPHGALRDRDRGYSKPGVDVLTTTEQQEDGSVLLSIVEMPEGPGGKR
jgi:hypothetical protein